MSSKQLPASIAVNEQRPSTVGTVRGYSKLLQRTGADAASASVATLMIAPSACFPSCVPLNRDADCCAGKKSSA